MNNEKEKDEGPVRSAELEHRAPSRLDAWVTALKSDAHRVRTSPLQPPPVDRRFARFLWGLLLPFSLLRIGTNAPGAKETFVRTGALTGAITLTAALLLVLSPVTRSWFEKGSDRDAGALVEDEDEAPLPRTGRKNALSRALRQLRSEVGKLSQRSAARERGAIRSALSEVVDSSEELLEEDRTPRVKDKEWERTLKTDMRKALGELADAGVELDAQLMIDGGESGSTVHALTSAIDDDDGDDERGELASLRDDTAELREALHLPATEAKEAEVRATARSAPLVTATRWIRDLTRDVRARRLEKEENISFWDRLLQAGWINRTWKLILALYAALAVVEWSILALSRDYQDQVMRNLSVVTGTPPDDPEVNPRIRIDFRWLRRRFKRRIRGLYLFFMGSIPLGMFGWLPGPSEQLASAAIALWAGYWLAVFTLAKTRLAWDDSETREPWYVRAYARSVGVVPGLGWYGRAMRRLGGSVRAPCQTFEMAGYEAAGLAVSRLLLGWPGLYSFVRPVFTVAAQHVCLARPRLAQSPPSVPAPASVGRAPSRG